jgi:ATP-dependent RNA helicase SUPV3L1/SUV3
MDREQLDLSQLYKLFVGQYLMFERELAKRKGHHGELESLGLTSIEQFRESSKRLLKSIEESYLQEVDQSDTTEVSNKLFSRLRSAFVKEGLGGLTAELKYSLMVLEIQRGLSKFAILAQTEAADLRYPLEWFPNARAMQRQIHLHVGPTNSGKTFQALQRLEAAETGIYAGPLRLLAREVYNRLNAKGKLCALITGEEQKIPEGLDTVMSSCTVEMVSLSTKVDVAVIDEIQMMGHETRGWAWTQALLGLQAKEIHLCGEERSIPLVRELCAVMGDSLEIHMYQRLSPLQMMKESLMGDLTRLEKGDAVISFSRVGIHSLKNVIERMTGKRCAVVYGSLPPETRVVQADLFNDPENDYDFLVASDAIGMGLNLSIKRIIFESIFKVDSSTCQPLEVAAIKQIGGRAGRYRTASQDIIAGENHKDLSTNQLLPKEESIGYVTTLHDWHLQRVKAAMSKDASPLPSAGIFPPTEVIARFATYFPPITPFSYIIHRLYEMCRIHPRFHLCGLEQRLEIADAIQPYDLTVSDRLIFLKAPIRLQERGMDVATRLFAQCVSEQSGGELLEMKELDLEVLDEPVDRRTGKEYLGRLETLHKILTLYMWLSYRFAGAFRSRDLCSYVKSLVEGRIDGCLSEINPSTIKGKYYKMGG